VPPNVVSLVIYGRFRDERQDKPTLLRTGASAGDPIELKPHK